MNRVVLPPVHLGRDRVLRPLVAVLEAYQPKRPVRVEYKIAMPDKTPAQNRYIWAVPYTMLAEATGMEKEDIHEWNCGNQWGWKHKRVPKKPGCESGFENVPIRTTTENADGEPDPCSMEDMLELWARAQRLGASLNLVIPDPDPDYWRQR